MFADDFEGRVLPFDEVAAVQYADIVAARRLEGRPIDELAIEAIVVGLEKQRLAPICALADMVRQVRHNNARDPGRARGLIDADLGGGIIKRRVAREGQGRSGGYRMLVAYRAGARAVFLYALAKNERENIGSHELLTWRARSGPSDWRRIHSRLRALAEEILQEVGDGENNQT